MSFKAKKSSKKITEMTYELNVPKKLYLRHQNNMINVFLKVWAQRPKLREHIEYTLLMKLWYTYKQSRHCINNKQGNSALTASYSYNSFLSNPTASNISNPLHCVHYCKINLLVAKLRSGYSFNHLFNKYILITYNMQSNVLDTWKQTDIILVHPCSHEFQNLQCFSVT